jgi:hypothetical protein
MSVAPPVERRRHPRRRVLFQGQLSTDDAAFTANCSIRDLTEGGARISRYDPDALGRRPVLIVVREGAAYRTRAVWSDQNSVGLAFEGRADLRHASTPAARVLRRIWMDHRLA